MPDGASMMMDSTERDTILLAAHIRRYCLTYGCGNENLEISHHSFLIPRGKFIYGTFSLFRNRVLSLWEEILLLPLSLYMVDVVNC